MPRQKVIVIIGPTASGKTSIAVQLARSVNGEIISADSRQVYRKMDIGTGKDLEEYGEVPHHLIDIRDAGDEFSVSDFQLSAHFALRSIVSRKGAPIICGGTGHYVKALLDDYPFKHKKTDYSYTKTLESQDREVLYQHLVSLGLWESHHWEADSKRRIARAIEKALSQPDSCKIPFVFREHYRPRIYCISVARETLKDKIMTRLLQRFDQGMIEEVRQLLQDGVTYERLERYGLEYKWLSLFLRNQISKTELINKLATEIARYAKRQMTFFRYMERNGHDLIRVENREMLLSDAKSWLTNDN